MSVISGYKIICKGEILLKNIDVMHKGWEWKKVDNDTWDNVSAEFLPIALNWASKFSSMIDIGAGKGRHSFYMSHFGLSVKAVDLSESSIEIIKQKNLEKNCTVAAQVADMTDLPYDAESFDCAICFHTIYHTDLNGMKKAISEICRVLKPWGEVFITFNSKENSSFQKGKSIDNYTIYKTEGIEKDIPHTYVDFSDLEWLMEGFQLIKVQQIRDFVYKENPTSGNHYFVLARKL